MKNIINKTIIISFITLSINVGFSQNSIINKANESFSLLKYDDAIKYYNKANNRSESKESLVGLANSYYKINNDLKANEYYSKAYVQNYLNDIETIRYIKVLYNLQKYVMLNSVITDVKKTNVSSTEIDVITQSLENKHMMLKDSVFYHVSPYLNNDNYSYFSSTFFKDNLLVASDSPKSNGSKNESWKGGYYFDIFEVNNDTEKSLSNKINSPLHEASPSYCKSENTLYFTRSSLRKGSKAKKNSENENNLKIYSSIYIDGDWIEPEIFPFSSDEYSTGHPAINKSGDKLFFISDKEGGYGETDIYFSELINNKWSEPVNLGDVINTPGKEMFPTLRELKDTLYLYYSSNYKMGLGGLDIYVSKNYGEGWSIPSHLTYPINTEHDEFGIIWKEDNSGYFTSNRDNINGNDGIFKLDLITQKYYVAGYVLDGSKKTALSNTQVSISDSFLDEKSNLTTNEDGYFITELTPNSNFDITAFKDGYPTKSSSITTIGLTRSDTIYLNIELTNFPEFFVKGTIKDKATGLPITNGNILLEGDNNTSKSLIVKNGVFVSKIDSNTLYLLTTKIPNYFLKKSKVSTKGLKKSDTLYADFVLEKLEVNKAIKLDNIYYDLGKYAIRQDAKVALNDLIETLKDNPTITIELSSHTDSRGSTKSNQWLSQKRAQSAINYLAKEGIDKNRLTAVGYGEEKLLNKCKNGVKCSKEEHQLNRRTEFKVLSN